jgi:hypothetical protein
MFNIHPAVEPDRRPVYGWVGRDGYEHTPAVAQYGSVTIVMKDSVRERTTVTLGDSLNTHATPVPMNEMASPEQVMRASSHSPFMSSHPLVAQAGPAVLDNGRMYMEAQIHGGTVGLSDIERIVVNRDNKALWSPESVDKLRSLMSWFDIPVDTYSASDDD